jgi:hypothetical protein
MCPQLRTLDVEEEVYRLGFGCRGAATNVHLKTKLAKLFKDVIGAHDRATTRVEGGRAIARDEEFLELTEGCVPLAVRVLAQSNASFAETRASPRRHATVASSSPPA